LSPERIGKIATKVLAKRDHPSLVIVVCSFWRASPKGRHFS
jgi:hypothetical protein